MTTMSRRRFVTSALSATGAGSFALAHAAEGPCVLMPEQEVGPFYLADELIRSHIAEDRQGVSLRLRLVMTDVRTCKPLPGAAIDLWHCDAMGLYSGFTKVNLGPAPGMEGGPPRGGPPPQLPGEQPGGIEGRGEAPDGPPPPPMKPSDKLTFLRGIQLTDQDGSVTFTTIFPGFYQGRTNHIHFKVRLDGQRAGKTYAAGHTSHVGQVFFPEDWNTRLMAQGPYAGHHIHRTTEAEDGIFNGQGGTQSVATLVPADKANPSAGLVAELRVAVDPTATPRAVGVGGPGGPRRAPTPQY